MSRTQELANYKVRQEGSLDRPDAPAPQNNPIGPNNTISGAQFIDRSMTVVGDIVCSKDALVTFAADAELTVVDE